MSETSAEAREQIADHLREHSWVPCTNRGEAMPSGPWCSKCIARALAEKDVQLAEARRERDECRVVIRDHIPVFQAKIAALEADLAAMRGHVRTIQDQHRCGQEHVEHEYPCEICNAVHAALASSPGAAR